jgi:hypothetical protein
LIWLMMAPNGRVLVDAPLTLLFIKCGEFRQAEQLSATQEGMLHGVEWQDDTDDERRIAVECGGGGGGGGGVR